MEILYELYEWINTWAYEVWLAHIFNDIFATIAAKLIEAATFLATVIGTIWTIRNNRKDKPKGKGAFEPYSNGVTHYEEHRRIVIWVILAAIILPLFLVAFFSEDMFKAQDGFKLVSVLKKPNRSYRYFGQILEEDGEKYPEGQGRIYEVRAKRDGEKEESALVYHGGLKKGMLHGKGTMYEYETGEKIRIIEGTWLNDKLYGETIIKEAVAGGYKEVFTGDYYNGKRNGRGKEFEYYEIGNVSMRYTGGFYEGRREGFGIETLYDSDGRIKERYSGQWKEGQKIGVGTWETEHRKGEKRVHVGCFENDLLNGECIVYDANGKILDCGIMIDGVMNCNKSPDELMGEYPFPDRVF